MKKFKALYIFVILVFALTLPIVASGCNKDNATLVLSQETRTHYEVGEEIDVEGGLLKYTKDGKRHLCGNYFRYDFGIFNTNCWQ